MAARSTRFCALLIAIAWAYNPAHGEDRVQYNRDVRPILAKNCFACHGLDEASREAGLRLDRRDDALAKLESGLMAIVPGNARASELIARVASDDLDLRMPPAEDHQALEDHEIEVLTRWINEGADYQIHWSLVAPQKTSPPVVRGGKAGNAIDAFINARLEQEGLQPAPRADRNKLIRRLSLDLVGLPPSPEEVRLFVNDERPDAYERLVDRLLASPHFGERMAVTWLDAARYADTHGYHIDSHRDMWPWRDWVIQAFNDNLPFDQFTIWQLAGDLLPNASRSQLIASGFNRNHGINYEGGAIPEEYHVEYVVDRVNTTGTVWMGLTLGCARCHDHKYDPISQEEYFKLFAFFNTIDEKGLDGQRGNAVPLLPIPTEEQQLRQDKLVASIQRLESKLDSWSGRLSAAQVDWEKRIVQPSAMSTNMHDSGWYLSEPITEETAAKVLQTDYLNPTQEANWTQPIEIQGETKSWTKSPEIVDGHLHSFPWERSAMYLSRTLTVNRAQTATISIGCTDGLKFWLNDELLVDRDHAAPIPERQYQFKVELQPGENRLLVKVVNISWECDFYFAIRDASRPVPNAIVEIAKQSPDNRSNSDASKLRSYFRENIVAAEEFQQLRIRLLDDQRALAKIRKTIPTTMVMREQSEPRKTYRLDRGQYDSPKEKVSPSIPSVLPSISTEGRTDRLALAHWLTDPSHPLTARVTVNRLWQMLFGVGIVATSEDFGTQGEWPSHPELLDWLAVEFIESGWDVKHMLRLMVNSSTYRQSSAATQDKLERDPRNHLLSRGPRFRLQAEFIRDLALSTSGLLNTKIGGPSAKNYQPPGLWLELAHQKDNSKFTAQEFKQASGSELYRRGLYTFWKRSVPPPNLVTFDAPNREICTVRRERTNTPLQALVLLNDPTFVEASRVLAARLIREHDQSRDRIRSAFMLTTSREPEDAEVRILLDKLRLLEQIFEASPDATKKLLSVGDSQRDESLNLVEHAAWTNLASLLLNLDETITKE